MMNSYTAASPWLVFLLVLSLIVLADMVLTAALLARRGTRPAGVVLLLLNLLMVPAVGAALVFSARVETRRQEARIDMQRAEAAARHARLELLPTPHDSPPGAGQSAAPAAGGENRPGVLGAVGRSMIRGATQPRVPPAPRAARESTKVLEAMGKAVRAAMARNRKPSVAAPDDTTAEAAPAETPAPPLKPEPKPEAPGTEHPGADVADSDLRAAFERWLAARSDAAVSQLRAEFEWWLASGGPSAPAPGPGAAPAPAKPKPAWVDSEPGVIDGDYHTKVVVGPYATAEECEEALDAALQKAAADYAEKYLGPGGSRGLAFAPGEMRERLVAGTWDEVQVHDFPDIGPKPMIHRHALLRFDRDVKDQIRRQHRAAVVEGRLRKVGVGAAATLAILGLAFVFLKSKCPRQANPTAS